MRARLAEQAATGPSPIDARCASGERKDEDDEFDKPEKCIQKRRAVDHAWTLRAGDRGRSGTGRKIFAPDIRN